VTARKTNKKPLLSGKSPIPAAVLAAVIEKPGYGWDVASRASRRIGASWRIDRKHVYSYLERLEGGCRVNLGGGGRVVVRVV
jgi:DNA-binding PadR family transcriptional regulator